MLEFPKKTKNKSVFKFGIMFLFISTVSVASYLFLKLRAVNNEAKSAIDKQVSKQTEMITTNQWEEYVDEEFGIILSHPSLLIKRETVEHGEYLKFVRFEETKNSIAKGVALGISSKVLKEEINKIKNEMEKSGEAELTKEQNFKIEDNDAVLLEYETDKESDVENRVVVIFRKGLYTYSVSTAPDQMGKVLSSIKFI